MRRRDASPNPPPGVNSYISGRNEFSISIGLAHAGEPVLGVVYNPATEELFTAIRGGGAFIGGLMTRWDGEPDFHQVAPY